MTSKRNVNPQGGPERDFQPTDEQGNPGGRSGGHAGKHGDQAKKSGDQSPQLDNQDGADSGKPNDAGRSKKKSGA
jgi:hypothetical protein